MAEEKKENQEASPEEEEEEKCPECPPKGAPAWMATDMATLLMAFFVLILFFAEFNVPKFKQISGSMKNAFGIQRVIPVVEQPKGTTILSLNFSPNPTPAVQDNLKQQTTETDQPKVELQKQKMMTLQRMMLKMKMQKNLQRIFKRLLLKEIFKLRL